VGSNPGTVYWMAVTDASYYIKFILKNNKNKGSQMGNTKILLYEYFKIKKAKNTHSYF
jgi:hypothetical protein